VNESWFREDFLAERFFAFETVVGEAAVSETTGSSESDIDLRRELAVCGGSAWVLEGDLRLDSSAITFLCEDLPGATAALSVEVESRAAQKAEAISASGLRRFFFGLTTVDEDAVEAVKKMTTRMIKSAVH